MKRKEIIKILNQTYHPANAAKDDFIGLQIEGTEEINNIMITLDVTFEVILQAIENDVDLIITHHPFFFGDKETILKQNKYKNNKYNLLKKKNINVFAIHTNVDFGLNSIPYLQGLRIGLEKMESIFDNEAIIGEWSKEFDNSVEMIEEIKNNLEVNHHIRTNIINKKRFNKVVIASGASGDLIFNEELFDSLFIVGELKWHHWVYANELNLNVIELGHFSENIFKGIIVKDLEEKLENSIKIIESIEENGYSSI